MHAGMDKGRGADDSAGPGAARSSRAISAIGTSTLGTSTGATSTSARATIAKAVLAKPSTTARFLAAWLSVVLCAACGSTGSGSNRHGDPDASNATSAPLQLRVRWQVYSSGQDLALASQGLLDRASTYSQAVPITAANTKIAPDDVVDALIEHLDDQGLRSQPGAAPAAGQGWSQSIEIEQAGATRWIGVGAASPLEEQKRFRECWMSFTAVYNQTYQLQTVEQAPDWRQQDSVLKRQRQRIKSP